MRHLTDFECLHQWNESLFSYTFPLNLLGGHYGRRMIVIRSRDGKLLLFSPLPLSERLAAELEQLGSVRAVVYPTCFHDTGVSRLRPWLDGLEVYACPGFDKHLPSARPIDELPEPWSDLLEWRLLEGMPKINETVFYHRTSRTLLPSDLLFHFTPEFSKWTRFVARLSGTYPEVKPTRLFQTFIKDRQAFSASLEHVLQWDFERVLPSHAAPLDGALGRSALEQFHDRPRADSLASGLSRR